MHMISFVYNFLNLVSTLCLSVSNCVNLTIQATKYECTDHGTQPELTNHVT